MFSQCQKSGFLQWPSDVYKISLYISPRRTSSTRLNYIRDRRNSRGAQERISGVTRARQIRIWNRAWTLMCTCTKYKNLKNWLSRSPSLKTSKANTCWKIYFAVIRWFECDLRISSQLSWSDKQKRSHHTNDNNAPHI